MMRVLGDGGWRVAMTGLKTTLSVRIHDEQVARDQMHKRFQIAQDIAAFRRTRVAATKQSYKRVVMKLLQNSACACQQMS